MRPTIAVSCAGVALSIACATHDDSGKSGGAEKKAPVIIDSAAQLGDTTTKPPAPNEPQPADSGAFVVTPRPKTGETQPSGDKGNQPSPGVNDTASRGTPGPGTSDTASRPRGTGPGVSDTASGGRLLPRTGRPAAIEMMTKTRTGATAARKSVAGDTLVRKRKP